MDFKELLAPDTYIRVEYNNGNSECVSADYFFQAIKERLIDELGVELHNVGSLSPLEPTGARLIDTTGGGNGS
jgi:hypothetical protein